MVKVYGKSALTPDQFRSWRKRLRLTQVTAAEALGISPSQIFDYERGVKRGTDRPAPIPRVVELACAELERRATAAARS